MMNSNDSNQHGSDSSIIVEYANDGYSGMCIKYAIPFPSTRFWMPCFHHVEKNNCPDTFINYLYIFEWSTQKIMKVQVELSKVEWPFVVDIN